MHTKGEIQPLLTSEPSSEYERVLGNAKVLRNIENATIPETATYGRNISCGNAYVLVLSQMIGCSIFATPGSIVRSAGSVGVTLLLWIFGACIAACDLAIYTEYGCMLPRSGGDKVYLEFTYRRPRFLASTLFAISAVALGVSATNCIVFGQYMLFALGMEATVAAQRGFAVGLLLAACIIHGYFLKAGIRIQNILGWVIILIIAFMISTGIYVIFFQKRPTITEFPELFSWDGVWEGSNWGFGVLATSLLKVFSTFSGLCTTNVVLNEVKNPVRTLKVVGLSAFVTVCILYALINVAYFMVVPIEDIKRSGQLVAALFFERVFGPGFGKTTLPLLVAISAAGKVMVTARVNQEIARQGFLPFSRYLSSSQPFNTPLGGIIVHLIPTVLTIWLPPPGDVYNFILDVQGYPNEIFGVAITFGLILLRWRRPELLRPFKTWLPTVWFRMAVGASLIVAPFFPPPNGQGDVHFFYATYAIVGAGLIVLSVLYWWIWTIVLPNWNGYRLEEEVEILDDGTSITKLVHVSKQT
ncbi:methionine permease [Arthroderma uncinatum]|uniref:methionine permease n=1 Tax=Arthroderma uncinatum TaxID=74035 RepID=UPI00144AA366|nr:methionine permease [Arthroderma uncinatum]KAF3480973.1 methionine permease [Arthroderma uncinatum]